MNVVELERVDRKDGRYYREFQIGEHEVKGGARVRTVLIVEGPPRVCAIGREVISAYFLRREKLLPAATDWQPLKPSSEFVKLSQEDMFAVMAIVCRVNSGRNSESRENATAAKRKRTANLRPPVSPEDRR